MAVTREIAASDWKSFLPAWSERNLGQPVRLEAVASADGGMAELATSRPLLGIDVASKGHEAPAITIMLGGLDARMPEFTHVVMEPTHLWVEEAAAGRTRALEIQSRNGSKARLVVTSRAVQEEPNG